MIDAIVGSVIVVVATTALALAIEAGNLAITQAGRYPLTESEREVLRAAGLFTPQNILLLESDLDSLFND